MKAYLKQNRKFLLFVLLSGLIGGYCTGLYLPATLSPEITAQMQEQGMTNELLALSTMIQYGVLFGVIPAAIGIFLSKTVNLWKPFRFEKHAAIVTAIVSVFAGLMLYPGDQLLFGRFSSWVNDVYTVPPSLAKMISGLLVGGVIEEVLLRLFLMSLLVLVLSKLFCRKKETIPVWVLVTANIISALLFAAGHIPATAAMTELTPLLLFRCFLLNGGFGLCFGYLYRKYGIGYAMTAHGLAHLISDLLMIIVIG